MKHIRLSAELGEIRYAIEGTHWIADSVDMGAVPDPARTHSNHAGRARVREVWGLARSREAQGASRARSASACRWKSSNWASWCSRPRATARSYFASASWNRPAASSASPRLSWALAESG